MGLTPTGRVLPWQSTILLLRAWLETRVMLGPHPRLEICPILALYLHPMKNKACWRSSVCPPIQVRNVGGFPRKNWVQFFFCIQALVGLKYLPKSKLAFLVSVANVPTPGSLYPQRRAVPLKENPVDPSTSVTCIRQRMVFLFGSPSPT